MASIVWNNQISIVSEVNKFRCNTGCLSCVHFIAGLSEFLSKLQISLLVLAFSSKSKHGSSKAYQVIHLVYYSVINELRYIEQIAWSRSFDKMLCYAVNCTIIH